MSKIKTRFRISPKQVDRAFAFAEQICKGRAQSHRDFGSKRGRKTVDFIADTVEGKLAEEGFAKFLRANFGIDVEVDYDIYPDRNETDYGNDLQGIEIDGSPMVGVFKVDIKSARHYSKWLLVEDHKFRGANLYVLVTIHGLDKDWEDNPYAYRRKPIDITVAGFAFYTDFIHLPSKKPWFVFKQGAPLIRTSDALMIVRGLKKRRKLNPVWIKKVASRMMKAGRITPMKVRLKAPLNYGIPKDWLRSGDQWLQVVKLLKLGTLKPKNHIVYRQVK